MVTAAGVVAGLKTGATVTQGVSSVLASAISQMYRMGADANQWMDNHIADLMASEVPGISRTGRVLEAAKQGFAMGYIGSVIIIGTGQLLLGNAPAALMTAASAAVLMNPVATTCAAVGAIFYGWQALNANEKEEILNQLAQGFETGKEIIRSLVEFTANKMKEFSEGSWSQSLKTKLADWGDDISSWVGTTGEAVTDIKDSLIEKLATARKRGFTAPDQTVGRSSDAGGA